MLIKISVPGFINKVFKSKGSIFIPNQDVMIPKHRNILAVLRRGGFGPELFAASNIVTDAGDLHYAQRMAAESPTNAFTTHELGSAGTPAKGANRSAFTPIGSTQKLEASTYPKTNDGDADNTGAGTDIVTHLASYAKGDFTAASITDGWITNPTPGASEPILTGYDFAAGFAKTANDTLKVFVNHEALGV